MYVKVTNGVAEKYPYTLGQLRKDNPNVSFPKAPSLETLAQWGLFPVEVRPQPSFNEANQDCMRSLPVQENGTWVETWSIAPVSQEEISQRLVNKETEVRHIRNQLLTETDWRFRSDMNPSQEWIDYCQALRDVPSQAGFPWDVQWPVAPS
jgi:hypothetical protein